MIDLTPLDVRNKRGDFKRLMRGYDPQEVDIFLELAAERLEGLVRENLQLRDRAQTLADQVKTQGEREQAVQDALVTAQELRTDIRNQSQREADHVLKEAEIEARQLIAEAEAEVRRVLAEADAEVRSRLRGTERKLDEAAGTISELERRRGRFLKEFRALLQRELDVVEVEDERPPFAERAVDLDLGQRRSSAPPVTAPVWPDDRGGDDQPDGLDRTLPHEPDPDSDVDLDGSHASSVDEGDAGPLLETVDGDDLPDVASGSSTTHVGAETQSGDPQDSEPSEHDRAPAAFVAEAPTWEELPTPEGGPVEGVSAPVDPVSAEDDVVSERGETYAASNAPSSAYTANGTAPDGLDDHGVEETEGTTGEAPNGDDGLDRAPAEAGREPDSRVEIRPGTARIEAGLGGGAGSTRLDRPSAPPPDVGEQPTSLELELMARASRRDSEQSAESSGDLEDFSTVPDLETVLAEAGVEDPAPPQEEIAPPPVHPDDSILLFDPDPDDDGRTR